MVVPSKLNSIRKTTQAEFDNILNGIRCDAFTEVGLLEGLDSEQIVILANALKTNTSLNVISMRGCNFNLSAITAIADTLKVNRILKVLDLAFNDITDEGAVLIEGALNKNPIIETLIVCDVGILPETVDRIRKIIENHRAQAAREAAEAKIYAMGGAQFYNDPLFDPSIVKLILNFMECQKGKIFNDSTIFSSDSSLSSIPSSGDPSSKTLSDGENKEKKEKDNGIKNKDGEMRVSSSSATSFLSSSTSFSIYTPFFQCAYSESGSEGGTVNQGHSTSSGHSSAPSSAMPCFDFDL